MRIGIITFHCSYNFGSALQAVALKRELEILGHQVWVIDYRSRDFDVYRLLKIRRPVNFLRHLIHYRRNVTRRDAFEKFMREWMNLTPRFESTDDEGLADLSECFDCFVCGSDQIWNLDCTRGPIAPFFLSFAGEARRIAYAPSLSHQSFRDEYFGDQEKRMVSNWLSSFSAISVREESTIPLFQSLTSTKIQACLDPTLLLAPSDYAPIITDIPEAKGKLFVYMLERNDALVAYAGSLAALLGLTICYVSMVDVDFGVPAVNLYGIGPSEFLGAIRGAAAVVTNSFHATVFSLLFSKPFQTFATRKSGSRMIELLEMVGCEDHIVDGSMIEAPRAVAEKTVIEALAKRRETSISFLEDALSD